MDTFNDIGNIVTSKWGHASSSYAAFDKDENGPLPHIIIVIERHRRHSSFKFSITGRVDSQRFTGLICGLGVLPSEATTTTKEPPSSSRQ